MWQVRQDSLLGPQKWHGFRHSPNTQHSLGHSLGHRPGKKPSFRIGYREYEETSVAVPTSGRMPWEMGAVGREFACRIIDAPYELGGSLSAAIGSMAKSLVAFDAEQMGY